MLELKTKLTCNVIHVEYFYALFLVTIQETVLLISILRCKCTQVLLKQCYNFWQAYLYNLFLSTLNFSLYNAIYHSLIDFIQLFVLELQVLYSYKAICLNVLCLQFFIIVVTTHITELSVKYFQKKFFNSFAVNHRDTGVRKICRILLKFIKSKICIPPNISYVLSYENLYKDQKRNLL